MAEYSGSTVLRRYVQGADADEPVIWYEGSGFSDRRWLHADNQGSIIAYSDGTGTGQAIYGYGPYGEPNIWSGSRYRYTGQIEIPEAALYYYKARVYDPTFGRFLQTDPIGYASDVNGYAYVGNDPFNESDPSGTTGLDGGGMKCPDICLTVYGAPQIPIDGICGLSGCSDITDVLNRNFIPSIGLNVANVAPSQPAVRPQTPLKPCTSGARTQIGLGSGATGFLAVLGVSGSAQLGVSFSDQLNFVQGMQFYVSGEFDVEGGLGVFFAGLAPQGTVGTTTAALRSGTSLQGHGEIGAAYGEGIQVAGNQGPDGQSISVAPAGGIGVYDAGGGANVATLATPPLFCGTH